jgi:hypothetical protein
MHRVHPLSTAVVGFPDLNARIAMLPSRCSDSSAPRLRVSLVGFAAALLALCGCQEEGVTKYTVPKELAEPPAAAVQKVSERLLGALVPRGDQLWYFKMKGPEKLVTPQDEAFRQFLDSIQFGDGDKLTWKLPEGWQESRANDGVSLYAVSVGSKESPLTLTIGRLPLSPLTANVDRWRGQLGLPPLRGGEMEQTTTRRLIGGVEGVVVDLTGAGKGAHPPMMAPRAEPPKNVGVKYKAPDDWKPAPNNQFSKLRFAIGKYSSGEEVQVTLSIMGPQNPLENVLRWRQQVGLGPITAEQLAKESLPLELPDAKVVYVEMAGRTQKMLGVLATRNDQTWVFKMIGDPSVVDKQKAAFEAFVKSVQAE